MKWEFAEPPPPEVWERIRGSRSGPRPRKTLDLPVVEYAIDPDDPEAAAEALTESLRARFEAELTARGFPREWWEGWLAEIRVDVGAPGESVETSRGWVTPIELDVDVPEEIDALIRRRPPFFYDPGIPPV